MDVLIIYQFCTFGGVERVVLNRAKAFKNNNRNIKLTVGYLHDPGALSSFQAYILEHQLEKYLSALVISDDTALKLDRYDYILVIDTPQIFDKIKNKKNVYIECHTPYIENRLYLKDIPENIQGIIVPSASFQSLILTEFQDLPPIHVIPNTVPEEFYAVESGTENLFFSQRPLTYFGRLDELKNFEEARKIFRLFNDNEDIFFIIIGNGANSIVTNHSLEKNPLLEKTLLRNQIDFDKAPYLINLVKQHQGIFISPSKAESFGLCAAEFISGAVPVLLSNIPEHCALVEDDQRFLYPVGDIESAKQKLDYLLNNWEIMSEQIKDYSKKFRDRVFINAWDKLIKSSSE